MKGPSLEPAIRYRQTLVNLGVLFTVFTFFNLSGYIGAIYPGLLFAPLALDVTRPEVFSILITAFLFFILLINFYLKTGSMVKNERSISIVLLVILFFIPIAITLLFLLSQSPA